MNKYLRRDRVLAYIRENQHVTVAQICDILSVSEATARRILNELSAATEIERVRGGAIAIQSGVPERDTQLHAHAQEHEKQQIGKAAAELVQDGDTVFLGSGTTVLEVAYHLGERGNLTVMTNSGPIIELLKDKPNIMLFGLGGILWHREQSFIGHITEQALSQLHADKVITGIRAISTEKGLSNRDPMCTPTERAILAIGDQVIIVADHTKCNTADRAFVAPLSAIHTLITDAAAPADFVATLRSQGITVIQAA
ncbi:MAG TPA: DeoR/GlpR family DNA-binding transcription regulator [Roseiflexaceae bacterium]|nr:DeoR/GlpR family DNA-binding transcription regulator [Roseiflexaceae bacterium]